MTVRRLRARCLGRSWGRHAIAVSVIGAIGSCASVGVAAADCTHPYFPTQVGSTWKLIKYHIEESGEERSEITTLRIAQSEGERLGFVIQTDRYSGMADPSRPPDVSGAPFEMEGRCSPNGVVLPSYLFFASSDMFDVGLETTVLDGGDDGAMIGPAAELRPQGTWRWTWWRTVESRWRNSDDDILSRVDDHLQKVYAETEGSDETRQMLSQVLRGNPMLSAALSNVRRRMEGLSKVEGRGLFKVVGAERVRTPAGEFEALKVTMAWEGRRLVEDGTAKDSALIDEVKKSLPPEAAVQVPKPEGPEDPKLSSLWLVRDVGLVRWVNFRRERDGISREVPMYELLSFSR